MSRFYRTVSNFSKDVYNKGIELGKKAIEIGKELISKISEITKNVVDVIKKSPERLWDACVDLYSSVSDELGEIWKSTIEKGGEWVENTKGTIINIYKEISKKLSEGISTFKQWAEKNSEAFKKMVESKKQELMEAGNSAKKSANETIKKIGNAIVSFYEEGKEIAENVALFSIGLIILPFYGSYLLAKETYKLGEEGIKFLDAGIETIKVNSQSIWQEFIDSIQVGKDIISSAKLKNKYNELLNKWKEEQQSAGKTNLRPGEGTRERLKKQAMQLVGEKRIIKSFESFFNGR